MLMSSPDENNKTSEKVPGLMTDGWRRMGGSPSLDRIIGLLLFSKLNSYFLFGGCQRSSSEDLQLPGVTTFCSTHVHLMEDLLFQEKLNSFKCVFYLLTTDAYPPIVQRMFAEC